MWTAAYKNTTTLSWDYCITQLMSAFGLNEEALKVVWYEPKPGDASFHTGNLINPAHKAHVHFAEEMYQCQLLSGAKPDSLSQKIAHYLDQTLRWEMLVGPATLDVSESSIQLSLKTFYRSKLIDMINGIYVPREASTIGA